MARKLTALVALTLTTSLAAGARAQKTAPIAAETRQHIDHVQARLGPMTMVKDEAPAVHTLAERMAALHVPGVSIAVVHNGRIEWAQGFGVEETGGAPVTAETMFQAGSISKPLAAMAVLRLVQAGKLALDADVNTLLTSWKLPADPKANSKPVTLRELLTHTGALTVHGFPGYAAGAPLPTVVQVLNGEKPANTAAIRSEGEPGTKWNYSGGGYTIMQQLAIDQTREPFDRLIQETVLNPIGMTHSTYAQPLPARFHAVAAVPYHGDGTPIEGGAHTYPELAAAGLWTTASDLALYELEMQRSLEGKANHVLTREMTRQMLTPGLGGWGLGLQIGGSHDNPHFGHGGSNAGFEDNMVAYEHSGEGAVVMTDGENGSQLADEVIRSIAVEYGWPDFQPEVREAIAVDPKSLEDFAGTYQLAPKFNLVVTPTARGLRTQATGQRPLDFRASSANRFFALEAPIEIEFTRDEGGKVTGLTVHQGGRDFKAPRQ